jgi:acyl-coenzyme A synthetase/AMP-(fatty) acid ligase
MLIDANVTVLSCVPTLLSMMDQQVHTLNLLILGGEACPKDLIDRWGKNVRMVNTYGPTEATGMYHYNYIPLPITHIHIIHSTYIYYIISTIIYYHLLSSTIIYYHLLSSTIIYYHLLSSTIIYYHLLSTIN